MFKKLKTKLMLGAGAATLAMAPVAAHAEIAFDAGIDESSVSGILNIVGVLFSEFWMLFALGLALIVLPRIINVVKQTASSGRAR